MVLPAFGMISEVIPVFSRKPIFGYEFVAGVDRRDRRPELRRLGAPHVRRGPRPRAPTLSSPRRACSSPCPPGVKIFNWVATMWGGSIRFTTAMLFAVAFLMQFVIGGLSGVTFAVAPIDWQMTDTYYVVAHFHYVLFGGTAFAVIAAIYYWFPKMTGRLLDERLGRAHFWLMVLGFNLTFFVQHFLGLLGMPRRVYTYPDLPDWGALNMVSTVGAFIHRALGAASSSSTCSSACASARSPATTRGTRGRSSGRRPRRRPITTSSAFPPSAADGPSGTSRTPKRRTTPSGPTSGGRTPERSEGASDVNRRPAPRAPRSPSSRSSPPRRPSSCCSSSPTSSTPRRRAAGPRRRARSTRVRTGLFTVLPAREQPHALAGRDAPTPPAAVPRSLGWLGVTIALGVGFHGRPGREYAAHVPKRRSAFETNLFATTFFTLTGFHGLHVIARPRRTGHSLGARRPGATSGGA